MVICCLLSRLTDSAKSCEECTLLSCDKKDLGASIHRYDIIGRISVQFCLPYKGMLVCKYLYTYLCPSQKCKVYGFAYVLVSKHMS